MTNLEFFFATMLIYAALNGMQALGLNMQFGQSGIFNFAYIVLVAVGAYATGVASLHPASPHDPTTAYIGGFGWGFPWNIMFGTVMAMVFALVLGIIAFRRLRHDYLALTLVSIGQGLWVLASNDLHLLNGLTGLSGVHGPLQAHLSYVGYYFLFIAIALAGLALTYVVFRQVEHSPLGRTLKALREDEIAVASLGKSPIRLKNIGFLLGAGAAGLAGSLLIMFVGGWSPNGWLPGETFVLIAAVIIGGRGRNAGALLGSILFLEILLEGSQFLNVNLGPGVLPAVQQIVVGLILLAFLWWRPQGILPEKRERFPQELADAGDVQVPSQQSILRG